MNFYKFNIKKFALKTSVFSLRNEFNLSRKELRLLNNEMKTPWVRPGWDKFVNKILKIGGNMASSIGGCYIRDDCSRRIRETKQGRIIHG